MENSLAENILRESHPIEVSQALRFPCISFSNEEELVEELSNANDSSHSFFRKVSKESVQVFVRIKGTPLSSSSNHGLPVVDSARPVKKLPSATKRSTASSAAGALKTNSSSVSSSSPAPGKSVMVAKDGRTVQLFKENSSRATSYSFQHTFPLFASQVEVYSQIRGLIQSFVDGFNATIIAYGVANSGKTYTLFGSTDSDSENSSYATTGVVSLAMREAFKLIKKTSKKTKAIYHVEVSYVEFHNNHFHNLIEPHSPEEEKANSTGAEDFAHNSGVSPNTTVIKVSDNIVSGDKIDIHESTQLGVFLSSTSTLRVPVESAEEANALILRANRNRITRSTKANANASRGHSILTVFTESRSFGTAKDELVLSKLQFVDLASADSLGSRKPVGATTTAGRAESPVKKATSVETQNINLSLSALGDVLSALSAAHASSAPAKAAANSATGTPKPSSRTTTPSRVSASVSSSSSRPGSRTTTPNRTTASTTTPSRVRSSGSIPSKSATKLSAGTNSSLASKSVSSISTSTAAVAKSSFIPYKNSKLTHYLKDALGGNSKTVFLLHLRAEMEYHVPNSTALTYANWAKNISANVFRLTLRLGQHLAIEDDPEVERQKKLLEERSSRMEMEHKRRSERLDLEIAESSDESDSETDGKKDDGAEPLSDLSVTDEKLAAAKTREQTKLIELLKSKVVTLESFLLEAQEKTKDRADVGHQGTSVETGAVLRNEAVLDDYLRSLLDCDADPSRQSTSAASDAEVRELSAKVASLQLELEMANDVNRCKIELLEADLTRLRLDHEKQLEKKQLEIDALLQYNDVKSEEYETLLEQIENMNKENHSTAQSGLTELESRITFLTDEIESSRVLREDMKSNHSAETTELHRHIEELKALNDLNDRKESEVIDTLNEQITDLNRLLEETAIERDKLGVEAVQLTTRVTDFQQENDSLKSSRDICRVKEIDNINMLNMQIDTLIQQKEEMNDRLEFLSETLANSTLRCEQNELLSLQLQSQLAQREKDCQIQEEFIQQQRTEYEAERNRFEQMIANRDKDLKKLGNEIAEALVNEMKNSEQKRLLISHVSEITIELNKKNHENLQQKQEYSKLYDEFSQLQTEISLLKQSSQKLMRDSFLDIELLKKIDVYMADNNSPEQSLSFVLNQSGSGGGELDRSLHAILEESEEDEAAIKIELEKKAKVLGNELSTASTEIKILRKQLIEANEQHALAANSFSVAEAKAGALLRQNEELRAKYVEDISVYMKNSTSEAIHRERDEELSLQTVDSSSVLLPDISEQNVTSLETQIKELNLLLDIRNSVVENLQIQLKDMTNHLANKEREIVSMRGAVASPMQSIARDSELSELRQLLSLRQQEIHTLQSVIQKYKEDIDHMEVDRSRSFESMEEEKAELESSAQLLVQKSREIEHLSSLLLEEKEKDRSRISNDDDSIHLLSDRSVSHDQELFELQRLLRHQKAEHRKETERMNCQYENNLEQVIARYENALNARELYAPVVVASPRVIPASHGLMSLRSIVTTALMIAVCLLLGVIGYLVRHNHYCQYNLNDPYRTTS